MLQVKTQSFKSIKKIQLTILNLLLFSGIALSNPIGDVKELTGVATLLREDNPQEIKEGYDVVLYDEARTGNGRMLIEFLDEEELALTEHSIVYIDEAYYDPDPSLSKMSISMVQGTARFASGTGSRIRKSNINVSTPTAQIAIRGTNFSTTIDELGRTLVILLPDEDGITPSGEIDVSNEGGTITLNKAFEATMVATVETPPTRSVVINNITTALIDNMFIVNPPEEVQQVVEEEALADLEQDQGLLDIDFLEFNELEGDAGLSVNELDEFSELDIDMLDVDFLTDLLDVVEELERTTIKLGDTQTQGSTGGDFKIQGATLGFNKDSQYNVFVQDGDLYLYRNVNGVIEIIIAQGGNGYVETYVEGYQGTIGFGDGSQGIQIIINQSN
jgi:hypothetical protein